MDSVTVQTLLLYPFRWPSYTRRSQSHSSAFFLLPLVRRPIPICYAFRRVFQLYTSRTIPTVRRVFVILRWLCKCVQWHSDTRINLFLTRLHLNVRSIWNSQTRHAWLRARIPTFIISTKFVYDVYTIRRWPQTCAFFPAIILICRESAENVHHIHLPTKSCVNMHAKGKL